MPLSEDHKPSHPAEKARIEAAGGWVHNDRLHGVLGVSRAFGDVEHKRLKEVGSVLPIDGGPLYLVSLTLATHTRTHPRGSLVTRSCGSESSLATPSWQSPRFVARGWYRRMNLSLWPATACGMC